MKSGKLQTLLVFGAMVITLTACSMEASIQSLVDDIKILKAPGQAHGIVSGAGQAQVPTTGTNHTDYKVSAAVGAVGGSTLTTSTSLVHTTASGLKVYSTVQGAIVSQ